MTRDMYVKIYVGIDLAASPKRCSGYAEIICEEKCLLRDTRCLYSDDEIINSLTQLATRYKRVVVSVDAPFSLGSGMRLVDRKMISLGFRVFPPGFGAMRKLTLRAMRLIEKLGGADLHIYETHPRSAINSSGCGSVKELLHHLSIEFSVDPDTLRKDLRDAVVAAVVSYCIDMNCFTRVEEIDGVIWLLKRDLCSQGSIK